MGVHGYTALVLVLYQLVKLILLRFVIEPAPRFLRLVGHLSLVGEGESLVSHTSAHDYRCGSQPKIAELARTHDGASSRECERILLKSVARRSGGHGSTSMAPGVGLAWTPGERLITAPGEEPSCEVASWDFPAPFHKLFFQGHLHFMDRAPALDRSRAFRAVLLECLDDIKDLDSPHSRDLRDALTVWSFVEAVYLVDPAHDSSHVSSRLADWYALNFDELHAQAYEALRNEDDPANAEEENSFWVLVTRLAAVGSRALARRVVSSRIGRSGFDRDWAEAAGAAALGLNDDEGEASGHSPLAIAEALLGECPISPDSSFAARTDASWVRWQDTCGAWADEQMEGQEMKLKLLLKVMAGSVPHIAKVCTTWEEMLVATATYARRVLSDSRYDHSVVEVENACAEATAVYEPPHQIAGGALVEAALGQPAEAIVRLGASLNTTWYAAHLCDLMMQAKQLKPDAAGKWMPAPGNVGLLEYLILEFTNKLERNRGMWRIAADYYNECPRRGQQCLTEMLGRVMTDGAVDPVIEKVIAFCESNKLPGVAKDLCARVGAECAETKNFGGAVYWYSRAKLLDRVVEVAHNAIAAAEFGGPGSMAARVLAHVVSAAAVATASDSTQERIAYASVYVQFQENVASAFELGALDEVDVAGMRHMEVVERAGHLALRLVCGGGLPRRFWAVVVYDVCRLLKEFPACAAAVTTDSLYELLAALEIVSSPSGVSDTIHGLARRLENDENVIGSEQMMFNIANAGPDFLEVGLKAMRETLLEAVTESFASAFS